MTGVAASAAGAQSTAWHGTAIATPATSPAGYSVKSASFSVSKGAQTEDVVNCPSGTVPWGGGAEINRGKVGATLNSSFSWGEDGLSGWAARVNNTTTSTLSFVVYAVCANQPAGYEVESGAIQDDPAGTRAGTYAACPAGKVSIGGGVYPMSSSTSVNISGIEPINADGIYNVEVYMNNSSGSDSSIQVEAICANKPTGYVMKSVSAAVPSRKDSSAHAVCPTNSVIAWGGALSNGIKLTENVNASMPDGDTGWLAYVDNGSASSAKVTSYAICVK
jgi:hypothetical protein